MAKMNLLIIITCVAVSVIEIESNELSIRENQSIETNQRFFFPILPS